MPCAESSPIPEDANARETVDRIVIISIREKDVAAVMQWPGTLGEVSRSPPRWIGRYALTLPPSQIAQSGLNSLFGRAATVAPALFPTDAARAKFVEEWRDALLSAVDPPEALETILSEGTSNTHPSGYRSSRARRGKNSRPMPTRASR